MLISVIVPVYNVENYLRKCLDSIINQTYKNVEIIIVDDGSTDGCGAICDEYAKKDSRVNVLHKTNGGVSSARNLGIYEAGGEYICFVDGDDWLELDYFAEVVQVLKEERPVLLLNNTVKEDDDGNITCEYSPSQISRWDAEAAFYEIANACHVGWEAVASFYEATACKKISFDERMHFSEDLLFRYQFTKMNPGLYLHQFLCKYHYYMRSSSAVNSYPVYKKMDIFRIMEIIMVQSEQRSSSVLFVGKYVPRLIGYYKKGINSSDARDIAAAIKIKSKIKENFWRCMRSSDVTTLIKCKLLVCLLPVGVLNSMDALYKKIKRFYS